MLSAANAGKVEESDVNKPCAMKIYGERNTGTNYLSELVDLNIDTELLPGVVPGWINFMQQKLVPGKEWLRDLYFRTTFDRNLGWKHTCADVQRLESLHAAGAHTVNFVTVTKNPYSWLLSLHRRPYHNRKRKSRNPGFEDFLEQQWPVLGRENVSGTVNPIQLWNRKNRSYMEIAESSSLRGLALRYEDILENPEKSIEDIASRFDCKRRADSFLNYTQSTKDASKDAGYYRDYYLGERWAAKLSSSAIGIINRYLDDDLMTYFCYRKIFPSD